MSASTCLLALILMYLAAVIPTEAGAVVPCDDGEVDAVRNATYSACMRSRRCRDAFGIHDKDHATDRAHFRNQIDHVMEHKLAPLCDGGEDAHMAWAYARDHFPLFSIVVGAVPACALPNERYVRGRGCVCIDGRMCNEPSAQEHAAGFTALSALTVVLAIVVVVVLVYAALKIRKTERLARELMEEVENLKRVANRESVRTPQAQAVVGPAVMAARVSEYDC